MVFGSFRKYLDDFRKVFLLNFWGRFWKIVGNFWFNIGFLGVFSGFYGVKFVL